ncbi:aminotransferase class I/II-fold pyridoxal phosphate-dependent enzyme [Streptomyces sp. NPDC127190]|uniref:aminotransferase class I/II-fold pyridoxal phosphate-dependent enzyme n=1 Tax=unclassified Streptomyces TaxID=2593676 RepID=UPI00362609CF
MPLFDISPPVRPISLPREVHDEAMNARPTTPPAGLFTPVVDDATLEVFQRAVDPEDAYELRDLWLGRVEHRLGTRTLRPEQAERWRNSTVRRQVTAEEVLTSRATVRFVKELFNSYFRDDLYGRLRPDARYILSGGSVDEEQWGLPETIKDTLRYALSRDWYGYSDSCGRTPAREAVAAYESARIADVTYTAENVALTMGGTFAVSSLADFVLSGSTHTSPALCAIPNYPPLVEAIARRTPVRLVPVSSDGGVMSVDPIIAALTPDTPFVMLQTAANPTGAGVREADLERLIRAASPNTMILLDECHEWLGPKREFGKFRAASNVIRVSSLSKNWSAPGVKAGWIVADAAFIASYYEYASTSFGGPPSFLYTAIEVLARMERWLITGVTEVGAAELAEFEETYELGRAGLQSAYDSYRQERDSRESALTTLRDASVGRLAEVAHVLRPEYSINAAAVFDRWDDSYLCFRELLRETGVSVYPGILNFGFGSGVVRLTTARSWTDLSPAFDRIRAVVRRDEVVHA